MDTLNNKYLYLLAASPILIFAPFFFGFPQAEGMRFFVTKNGAPYYVSELYFLSSQLSYGICVVGILLLVISLVALQKQYGVKPRIILILIDQSFITELYNTIKHNNKVKLIILFDIIFCVLLFFRW